jgi:hypothetical protein
MFQLDQARVGSLMNNSQERRIKPRVICDYPVIIEGYDVTGRNLTRTRLANLSASGP